MRRLAATLAMCSILSACATPAVEQRPEVEIRLEEPEKPPAVVKGLVRPVPEPETPEQKTCYNQLGIKPEYYLFDEGKALAAAELRIYAQETYDTSSSNNRMCKVTVGVMQQELMRSEQENRAYRERDASWWFQNKTTVVGVSMFALGAITAITIVYGLNPAIEN